MLEESLRKYFIDLEEILKKDIKLSLRNLEISFKKRQTNLSFKKLLKQLKNIEIHIKNNMELKL